ncbi:MAG TPA: hypothetical protein VHV75_19455 [Solirubrobacteraceae bacterium]|jgi:hypothetical protein|nr:hypothetical protein [Solirubrobacteraceae bacterium]
MKRVVTALAAMLGAAAMVPAAASAADIQIGVTATPLVSPICPSDATGNACRIVLTQVTAYETLRDGVTNPTTIKQSGEISSFTLGLTGTATITAADISYLDKTYGGPPEAQLTVLRPTGTAANPTFRVAAQSPVFKLRPELGQVAEFPLVASLPVVRGEILGLTVPTWAPVLSFELDTTKFSYAQSRTKQTTSSGSSCNATAAANLAQITIGALSNYSCTYPGTRVEYSALEITTPAGFSSSARKHKSS